MAPRWASPPGQLLAPAPPPAPLAGAACVGPRWPAPDTGCCGPPSAGPGRRCRRRHGRLENGVVCTDGRGAVGAQAMQMPVLIPVLMPVLLEAMPMPLETRAPIPVAPTPLAPLVPMPVEPMPVEPPALEPRQRPLLPTSSTLLCAASNLDSCALLRTLYRRLDVYTSQHVADMQAPERAPFAHNVLCIPWWHDVKTSKQTPLGR